ncbi:hypothetical protein [Bosea sp. MMO-172]|uniref:hypothetical protein n=1 Tax=Bosea sp. MMO-172 TaxID=3127885 RepID=UPI0030170782
MKPENDNIIPPVAFSVHMSGEHFTTVKDVLGQMLPASLGLGAAISAAQLGVTVEIITDSEAFAADIRTKCPEVTHPSLTVKVGSVSGPPLET